MWLFKPILALNFRLQLDLVDSNGNDSDKIFAFFQGQLLEGVECHIYLYCFTFDDINLNRAFVIIVLFPKKI